MFSDATAGAEGKKGGEATREKERATAVDFKRIVRRVFGMIRLLLGFFLGGDGGGGGGGGEEEREKEKALIASLEFQCGEFGTETRKN